MAKLLGKAPNQVPTNADLGTMAFQDREGVNVNNAIVANLVVTSAFTANTPFAVANSSASVFFAAANGNVGVGTNAPTQKLVVNGPAARFVSSGQGDLNISHSGLVSSVIAASSVQLALGAGGAEAARVIANGNIGIGNTTPGVKLEINAADTTFMRAVKLGGQGLNFVSGSAGGGIAQVGNGFLFFGTNSDGNLSSPSNERMRITNSGNVGIGNTAPAHLLRVEGTASIGGILTLGAGLNANGSVGTAGQVLISNGTATYWGAASAGAAAAAGSNTQVQFNLSGTTTGANIYYVAGNTGFGNTTPDATLAVTGTANVSGNVYTGGQLSVGANTIANTTALYLGNSTVNTVISQTTASFGANSTTAALYVAANGNIGIGNTAPTQKLIVNGNTQINGTTQITTGDLRVDNGYIVFGSAQTVPSIVKTAGNTSQSYRFEITNLGGNTTVSASPQWNGLHFTPPTAFANSTSGTQFPRTSAFFSYTSNSNPTDLAFNLWNMNNGGVGGIDVATKIYAISGTDGQARGIDIAANGNIGIGNTAPNARFVVTGTANVSGNTQFSANVYVAGNLGIGNNTPANKLLVDGGSAWFKPNNTGASADVMYLGRFSDSDSAAFIVRTNDATADALEFLSGRYNANFRWRRNSGVGERDVAHLNSNETLGTEFVIYHHETDNTIKVQLSTRADSYINAAANVGIGTATPNAKLQVVGTANVSGNVVFGQDLTVAGNLTVSGTTTYINTTALNIGDNIITLNADLTGATAPTQDAGVEVNRGSSANVFFLWNETTASWQANGGSFTVANSTVSNFFVAANGNVGIGNTAPTSQLQVTTTAAAASGATIARFGTSAEAQRIRIIDENSTGQLPPMITSPSAAYGLGLAADQGSGPISFYTGGTANSTNERVRLVANGNFGIGNTAPNSKLVVQLASSGDANNTTGIVIDAYGSVIRVGDAFGTAQTFANGVGFKIADTGNVHYSIGQIGGRLVLSDTSADANALYPATRTDILTANNSLASFNVPLQASALVVSNITRGAATLTTSATTINQVLHSSSAAAYRTARYLMQVTSGSAYQATEILIIHDGTNVYKTEYGTVYTGAVLATFDADINSGNLRLLCSPTNAVTVFKGSVTLITV